MLRPHSPTVRVGPTPYKGWAHLQGGQRSVSLEYQTCTSAYLFDTLVTGKCGTGVKLKLKFHELPRFEEVLSFIFQ